MKSDKKHHQFVLNTVNQGYFKKKYCEFVIVKTNLKYRYIFNYSGDPVLDRLTKRTIPEYGPPFFSPKYFPIHIMYYQIQKADRPAIRDTDHPFSVPNHKRTRKNGPAKKIHTFTVLYMHQLRDQLRLNSLVGPAVAGSTKGPALA